MKQRIHINLQPLGKRVEVEQGTSLQEILFAHGVEFPCGGQGRCRGCRVRVVEGDVGRDGEDCHEQDSVLSDEERRAGWRIACRCRAVSDVTLEVAQWEEAPILGDDRALSVSGNRADGGYGVAIDLGTTTIAGQLLDLQEGEVRAIRSALNPQAKYGADIMTRVEFALSEVHREILQQLIRDQLGELVGDLIAAAGVSADEVATVVIVGNTVMHHLFSGRDLEPLSHLPFESPQPGVAEYTQSELGWNLGSESVVRFLPCLGSFVGSDILAGILATRMHQRSGLSALVDLGTNGEIVIGNRERILCASTAAGPAFEGARISMGMRAASGAISGVEVRDGSMNCQVLGKGEPRGICGSGLVDAVAAGLDLGLIAASGRLADRGDRLTIQEPVCLTQTDIRELQLAKGAISAGLRILLSRWGAERGDLDRVFLAGAFGNYLDLSSARRIGLVDFPNEVVESVGNAALHGAKMVLFEDAAGDDHEWQSLPGFVEHIELGSDPEFMDVYVEEMSFPEAAKPVSPYQSHELD